MPIGFASTILFFSCLTYCVSAALVTLASLLDINAILREGMEPRTHVLVGAR